MKMKLSMITPFVYLIGSVSPALAESGSAKVQQQGTDTACGRHPAESSKQPRLKTACNDDTLPVLSYRAHPRLSMPRMYASAAAMYCSRENSSVTLTGTPQKIAILDGRQA